MLHVSKTEDADDDDRRMRSLPVSDCWCHLTSRRDFVLGEFKEWVMQRLIHTYSAEEREKSVGAQQSGHYSTTHLCSGSNVSKRLIRCLNLDSNLEKLGGHLMMSCRAS